MIRFLLVVLIIALFFPVLAAGLVDLLAGFIELANRVLDHLLTTFPV